MNFSEEFKKMIEEFVENRAEDGDVTFIAMSLSDKARTAIFKSNTYVKFVRFDEEKVKELNSVLQEVINKMDSFYARAGFIEEDHLRMVEEAKRWN